MVGQKNKRSEHRGGCILCNGPEFLGWEGNNSDFQDTFIYFTVTMRIVPECISCIIDDIVEALELLGAPRRDVDVILCDVMDHLTRHYADNDPASYYITEMHRIVKRHLKLAMPFAKLRQTCLSSCKEIAGAIAAEASGFSGPEKVRFLIRWAIAANTLDFRSAGAGYGFVTGRIEKMLRECFDKGLYVDD